MLSFCMLTGFIIVILQFTAHAFELQNWWEVTLHLGFTLFPSPYTWLHSLLMTLLLLPSWANCSSACVAFHCVLLVYIPFLALSFSHTLALGAFELSVILWCQAQGSAVCGWYLIVFRIEMKTVKRQQKYKVLLLQVSLSRILETM